MRVVVIGAGFAGLMAAWRLTSGGCEVVVLEARDRVGGRVWSQELIPGEPRTVIERGAEFVLDGYDVLRGVLAEVGLELADTGMPYYQREPRGGEPVSAQEVADCAAWVAAAVSGAPPGTSLAAVTTGWTGPPAALAAYLSRIETTDGVGAGLLAAAVASDATAVFGRPPCWAPSRAWPPSPSRTARLAGRPGPWHCARTWTPIRPGAAHHLERRPLGR